METCHNDDEIPPARVLCANILGAETSFLLMSTLTSGATMGLKFINIEGIPCQYLVWWLFERILGIY